MILNPKILKKLFRAVIHIYDNELGCRECYNKIDEFIEMKLAGKSAIEAYPLVQEHLDKCPECPEEFDALLTALEATS